MLVSRASRRNLVISFMLSPRSFVVAILCLVLPSACLGDAALRRLSPGWSGSCGGPHPYYGNVLLTFSDPVPTRGWPLMNNIHLNTQVAETNRLLGNATFTYD